MITIEQCRAARGLLDWTQQELADASGLSKTAINNFEKGHSDIKNESLRAIRQAFEAADIEFMEDGLRRRSDATRIIKGPNALPDLLDDIAATLKQGDELLVIAADADIASGAVAREKAAHINASKIKTRLLGPAPGMALAESLGAETRTLPADQLRAAMTVFTYGPKSAIQLWDNAMIVIMNNPVAAQAERQRFETLWAAASSGRSSAKSHSA